VLHEDKEKKKKKHALFCKRLEQIGDVFANLLQFCCDCWFIASNNPVEQDYVDLESRLNDLMFF
jgi:hypothetical protein